MNNCKEILLDDIVRVDFYDGATCTASVPFGVPGVESMTVTQGAVNLATATGTPVLSINIAGGEDIGALMGTPSHKAAPKRQAVGEVYEHTLTIPVELGFDAVKTAGYGLSGRDVLSVLTAYDGTKICVHYLPDSTLFAYEDTRGGTHTGQVKFTAQSLSGLVVLQKPSSTSAEEPTEGE